MYYVKITTNVYRFSEPARGVRDFFPSRNFDSLTRYMDQPRTTVRYYMDRLWSTIIRGRSESCRVVLYDSWRRCGAVNAHAVGRPPPVGVNQRSDCCDLLGTIPENVNTRRVPIQLVHVFCFKAKRQERKKNEERMEKKITAHVTRKMRCTYHVVGRL